MAVAKGKYIVLQTWGPDRTVKILDGVFHDSITEAEVAAQAEFEATNPAVDFTAPASKPSANFLVVAVDSLINVDNQYVAP